MKLYKVPDDTKIIFRGAPLFFAHIDGMYSFCTTPDGEIVHLNASAEVELAPPTEPA